MKQDKTLSEIKDIIHKAEVDIRLILLSLEDYGIYVDNVKLLHITKMSSVYSTVADVELDFKI